MDDASILSIIETPEITETTFSVSEAESIIKWFGRPVLLIRKNTFEQAASETWQRRLENARDLLESLIPSVGRIELKNHPRFDWVGTGWIVREDVIVTNRHVAEHFATTRDGSLSFRLTRGGRRIGARIDFLEEYRLPGEEEISIQEILYIEPEPGPDLALLRINSTHGRRPIPLTSSVSVDDDVCTIGYPARDSRIPDPPIMRQIFGDIYDVKRLAPGKITSVGPDLEHDCTTLGGNSGSVLVSLDHLAAVGVHYGGSYRTANFAVPAEVIGDRLSRL